MQRQIPPERAFSCAAPTLAPILAALSVTCTLRKWKLLLVRTRHTYLFRQQAREVLAGGVAQQVAVHAHVVAKESLADTAVEQVGAEEIETLRFLPEGFGAHDSAAISWPVKQATEVLCNHQGLAWH